MKYKLLFLIGERHRIALMVKSTYKKVKRNYIGSKSLLKKEEIMIFEEIHFFSQQFILGEGSKSFFAGIYFH